MKWRQKLCGLSTKHKWARNIATDFSGAPKDLFKCKICHISYWGKHESPEEILEKQLKKRLKRCPCCGSEKVYARKSKGGVMEEFCIECDNCFVNSGFHDTLEDAIAIWNDRWRFWQSKGGRQLDYRFCAECNKRIKINLKRYFLLDEFKRLERKGWVGALSGWYCPKCAKKNWPKSKDEFF